MGFVYKLHVPALQVSPHAEMYLYKTADISRCHTDGVHYPDLGIASDCLKQISLVAQPIRSTPQIWVTTRRHYGISSVVAQMSHRKPVAASEYDSCFLRLAEM